MNRVRVSPRRHAPFEVCTRQNEGLTDTVRKPQRMICGTHILS